MSAATHIILGGPEAVNGDEGRLRRASGTSRTFASWSCLKHTRRGDKVLIYLYHPVHAIVASARVLSDAKPGKRWRYEAKLGNVRWLKRAITLEEQRAKFPTWGWLKFCQGRCYLNSKRAAWLWGRAHGAITALTVKPMEWRNGAGFGDPETNRRVEKAAVDKVRRHLRGQGYRVVSREADKIGYDLDATKGERTLHVEVKGVSGSNLQFPITALEVRQAKLDRDFELHAVTNALSKSATLHRFTGGHLLKRFELEPLSFMAKER